MHGVTNNVQYFAVPHINRKSISFPKPDVNYRIIHRIGVCLWDTFTQKIGHHLPERKAKKNSHLKMSSCQLKILLPFHFCMTVKSYRLHFVYIVKSVLKVMSKTFSGILEIKYSLKFKVSTLKKQISLPSCWGSTIVFSLHCCFSSVKGIFLVKEWIGKQSPKTVRNLNLGLLNLYSIWDAPRV